MNLQSTLIKLVLLVTVVGPSLGMGLFGTSSMAAGSLAVSLLYVCIFIVLASYAWPHQGLTPWAMTAFFCTITLYFHGTYSFFTYYEFDLTRFWQSHLLLIVYTLGSYCLMILAQRVSTKQADKAIKFVFWTLVLSAIAGLTRFSPFFPVEAFKSVLFYGEPSHFALNFLPLLLYEVVRSRIWLKLALLFGSFVLCLMLENLTLMVGVALVLVMTVRLRLILLLFPVVMCALLVTNLEYYADRLDLSGNSNNLSALVYIQGLERAYLNFMETRGLGIGFQQFGIVGSMGDVTEDIKALIGYEANLLDGGSLAQKFIGEFGILGIFGLILYFGYFVRSARWLFRKSVGVGFPADPRDVFFHSCFAMYAT